MTEQNELHPAEVAKLKAETAKLEAEARAAEHRANAEGARAQEEVREEQYRSAHPEYRGIFYFDNTVSGNSVKYLMHKLETFSFRNPGSPILVDFNSPGGSVLDGLAWYDELRRLSGRGHHLTTRVAGVAASMAGILLQAGDTRIIGPKSWLHLHEVSTVAIGKAAELMDEAELAKRLTRQACDIYAEKSNQTSDQVWDLMYRKEVWLTPEQAKGYGFVDFIS